MRRTALFLALASALPLAACGGGGGGYDMRYVGTVTPEGGTHCDPAGPATLVLNTRSGVVSFVPGNGALILHGVMESTGTVSASLNTQPPGKPPFVLALSATRTEAGIDGTYTTPLCHARVALHPVH